MATGITAAAFDTLLQVFLMISRKNIKIIQDNSHMV